MKPERTQSRKPTVITNARWLAYATAGAASAFTYVISAEAEIHYSRLINHRFSGQEIATFPLGQLGYFINFRHLLHYKSPSVIDGGGGFFGAASAAGYYKTCAYNSEVASVSNLSCGQAISTRPFVPNGGILATLDGLGCGGGDRGQFLQAGIGFIGIKFSTGSGDQYGWARVEMRGAPKNQFRLIDYAYGDVGDRVRAGQKSGHEMVAEENGEMVPEEGSLGGLALGAAGLLAWRKGRSQAAR